MKCAVFDLDGTLAESKQPLSDEMARALERLLRTTDVAVVSGCSWEQFQTQFISRLDLKSPEVDRLFLFPTCGASMKIFIDGAWRSVYSLELSEQEKQKIYAAFKNSLAALNFERPKRVWGDQFEDRGSQITFSALGQMAPLSAKKSWDPTFSKRLCLIEALSRELPDFEIKTGGSTSVDVTAKGVDKRYCIERLCEQLKISPSDMLFVGDALFPGGNDYAVVSTGIETKQVSGPNETLALIDAIVSAR